VVTLFGRASSVNVQRVMWCCAEVGVGWDRVDVGGPFGGTATPAFLAMNPNAMVPVLRDGALVVWESNSIVRYLAEAYGGPRWYPADVRVRTLANQWMDWTLGILNPVLRTVYVGLVQTPAQRRERVARLVEPGAAGRGSSPRASLRRPYELHPHAVAWALKHAGELWNRLDTHLADNRFVAGDAISMGDFAPGPWYHRWTQVPAERPRLPHLDAWYARLAERPAFRANVIKMPL